MTEHATTRTPPCPTVATAGDLVSFVRRRPYPLGDEKALQARIEVDLVGAGYAFFREHRLDGKDIPDFFFPSDPAAPSLEASGVAMEVKIKGSKKAIYDQCARYCRHARVTGLVLVTNVAMGFPPEIEGKPCYVASLGMGWL